jgi:AcrR family transcriptional regulator
MKAAAFSGEHRHGTEEQGRTSRGNVDPKQNLKRQHESVTYLYSDKMNNAGAAVKENLSVATSAGMFSGMPARPYHHGTLRVALLEAAELILERDGLDQLSLRAISRAVGVSHAAPTHHFGDLRGLLTALAVIGFRRFALSLEEAAAAPKDPLRELGRSYVRFARTQPGLFLLMFHNKVLNGDDADFKLATAEAFAALSRVTAASLPGADGSTPCRGALASWCLVHGFSMLLLDGRLPPQPGTDALLEEVLA